MLSTMIDDKIDYLWSMGKTFDARVFTALRPWLMRGLPTSEEIDREQAATSEEEKGESKAESESGKNAMMKVVNAAVNEGGDAAKAVNEGGGGKKAVSEGGDEGGSCTSGDGKNGIAAARALFRWRDDATEAEETKRTGMGLLVWSSLNNNLGAVLELAEEAAANKSEGSSNEPNNALRVHRPDLFGVFLKGLTALHAAAFVGSWPMVEALLEMGANPMIKAGNGMDVLMAMSTFGRAGNIRRWIERFPSWNLSRRATSSGGLTALSIAMGIGPNKLEAVKALVEAGADPLALVSDVGGIVLHTVANNKDADEELVRYVLELPGVRALINKPHRARTFKWKVIRLAARLFVKLGTKKALLLEISEWSDITPLMFAARSGNAAAMKVLVEKSVKKGGADTQRRNVRGQTALEMLAGGVGIRRRMLSA